MRLLNVLLLGSGGRESAMISSILKSKHLKKCYFASGVSQFINNEKLEIAPINIANNDEILKFCTINSIDLVICGTETVICNGIADVLHENNILCFGPNKKAAELENSKIFMKDVLVKAGVPTAKYQSFSINQKQEAFDFIQTFAGKIVLKTDGLAFGKGVVICESIFEAKKELEEFFAGKFGDAGKSVIIEEFLDGKEVSIFAICDGKNAIPFFHACDYKKVYDGDAGLNTGGMGSFAPSFLEEKTFREIVQTHFNATLAELSRRDITYTGFLFGGIIITNSDIKFLEYNVRMGDPETQSIMSLLESDFIEILLKALSGNLVESDIKFSNNYAVTVVLASGGYPEHYEKNFEITGINNALCNLFSAGIKKDGEKFVTSGGRVLCVTAVGKTKEEARLEAYKNVKKIHFAKMHYRKDIAK